MFFPLFFLFIFLLKVIEKSVATSIIRRHYRCAPIHFKMLMIRIETLTTTILYYNMYNIVLQQYLRTQYIIYSNVLLYAVQLTWRD